VRTKTVSNFLKGLITSVEDRALPDGAASGALNWAYKGDRIELRRGYKVLGTEQAGAGKITGLHVTFKANGTQVLFRKRGRRLEYYNTATSDWAETGTNLFPAAASGEDATFSNYAPLAGNQMFLGSPNSSVYKVMAANPADYSDQAPSVKGHIKIKQNRTFLWGRTADKTGIYGSYIDAAAYTTVTAENVGSGNGVQTTFTGTLAFKGAGAKRTCFAVQIFESGGAAETFTDDYNGVLTGSAGGTGTINYMTGAFSVTFAAAPANTANNIKATYQWEDSTNQGVMDFSKSAPRTAGQGFVFRQDDGGGDAKSVESYGDTEYCFHRLKSWALTLTATDTNATNLIYRDKVGIPNLRASVATGDGVYYVDDYDQADPKFRLLTLNNVSTQVIPLPVSDQLSLTDYRFDKAATVEWGEYVLFACRHKDSAENNRVFAYNKRLKLWEVHDYYVSCFAVYNGALVAGDSISENVFELFSGFDDNGTTLTNYWEGNLTDLQVETLKKVRRFWVQGEISRGQSLDIYLATDSGGYVLVGTQNGTDSNVDGSPRTVIGSDSIGAGTLGGETSTTVYNYQKEIKLSNGKFQYAKVKFQATGIGHASVSTYTFFDIILNATKLPSKYRAAP
jgi:hypothetical protein